MALPLGKLTILIGAGIFGSVLAREGHMPSVPDFVSGAFKIAWKQMRRGDSTKSVSKQGGASWKAEVDSLRQELQMLALNRPVTIVTATGTGAARYGTVIVVVVVGYGYIWWKGWKLPDMMFATRRGLSDACTSIAQQLDSVYSSIRSTRRQLTANIDRVDSNLNEVAELTADTQERVTELREDSQRIGHDVRYVRNAVETLELKISRIEGKQELTNQGVKKLCDYAYSLENNLLEESQAPSSSSRITFPPKIASLPPSSSEPSTPSVSNGSAEVQRPPLIAASNSSQQRRNGISSVVEVSNGTGISSGSSTPENTSGVSNGSSWFRPFLRTRSGTAGSSSQQS